VALNSPAMKNFISKEETYQIIGICMEVHRELGFGFSEIVYKDAIEMEAILKNVQVEREKMFDVHYKGKKLRHKFYADFVMFDNIIVEIKACKNGISEEHIAQTLNYLKVSGCSVGLLINFGKKSLEHKRLVF
jgi:GxxExxY protein